MTTLTTTPSAGRPVLASAEGRTIQSNPDFRVQTETEIDAQFMLLEERRAAAGRAAISRQNAVIARAVAHRFAENARELRNKAASCGNDIDHAVDLWLADACQEQADLHRRMQADYIVDADRYGSL